MGNQLRALEAGLAVARVLGRMLVVPDYISDNGEGDTLKMIFVPIGIPSPVFLMIKRVKKCHTQTLPRVGRQISPDFNSV